MSIALRRTVWLAALVLAGVSSAPAGAAAQPAATSALHEAWHLDSLHSPLRGPRSLTLTGQCDLWVADERAGVVRIPCAGRSPRTPQVVAAIGRNAGENQEPWAITTVGRDSVLLFDRLGQRANTYATTNEGGSFAAAASWRLPEALYGQLAAMGVSGEAVRVWMHQFPSATDPGALNSLVLRLSEGGTVRDTLAALDGLVSVYWGSSFSGSHIAVPFQPRPLLAFLKTGGFVVGNTTSDVVVVRDTLGHEVRTITLAMPSPQPVSRADRDAYADSVHRIVDQDMDALHYNDPERTQYREQIDTYLAEDAVFPERRQRYDRLVVDANEESIWVLLPGSGRNYARTWQVYSLAGGTLERRVTVPHKGAVVDAVIMDGAMYVIEQPLGGMARVAKYTP